ncbi:hypothetical protein BKA56DRAFT_621350 [Ilyonectria sp. MPI-CAGE-AT-0026]|nr:hypothetical protein BKA56DRAFT_621350 [Ilyonectria sp. MPI-CAGE-AT-0026]
MSQYILASCNGLLCLEKPKPNANRIFLQAEHEWTKSDLDEICQDLFKAVSLESPSQDVLKRQESRGTSKQPTKQRRLVNRDGIITIWSPPTKYPLREGSCALATCSLESTMNLSSQAHILALPVELRLRIYRHLLILEDFRLPTFYPSIGSLRTLARTQQHKSLGISAQVLATCRQINREGTPMLCGENLFRREFYWPRKWYKKRQYFWPVSDSCRLKTENLHSVSRISIFRQYEQWLLDNGDLKVFRDFPALRELHMGINFADLAKGVDLQVLWQDVLKSVSRKQPKLDRLKCCAPLAFDRDYRNWCQRCWSRPLDFSLHQIKRRQFEEWIRAENLFPDQQLTWSFTTSTSQYAGPSCSVELVIDTKRNTKQTRIPCRIAGDGDEQFSLEAA